MSGRRWSVVALALLLLAVAVAVRRFPERRAAAVPIADLVVVDGVSPEPRRRVDAPPASERDPVAAAFRESGSDRGAPVQRRPLDLEADIDPPGRDGEPPVAPSTIERSAAVAHARQP